MITYRLWKLRDRLGCTARSEVGMSTLAWWSAQPWGGRWGFRVWQLPYWWTWNMGVEFKVRGSRGRRKKQQKKTKPETQGEFPGSPVVALSLLRTQVQSLVWKLKSHKLLQHSPQRQKKPCNQNCQSWNQQGPQKQKNLTGNVFIQDSHPWSKERKKISALRFYTTTKLVPNLGYSSESFSTFFF